MFWVSVLDRPDVEQLCMCRAGQAVVQMVEDTGTNVQYAIKFFLSTGAAAPFRPGTTRRLR